MTDYNTLYTMYIIEGRSIWNMAVKLNKAYTTVWRELEHHNIAKRSRGGRVSMKSNKIPLDELFSLPVNTLSSKYKVSLSAIYKRRRRER